MKKGIRRMLGRRMELVIAYYNPRTLYTEKPMRTVYRLLSMPAALLSAGKRIIPNVEMDLTSRCTLNCRECSHLIPYHRAQGKFRDYPIEELMENVDLLLPKIDACLRFRLLGGEPLMHKQIDVLIRRLIGEKKIRHIQIVTNGTIIPNESVLQAMQHDKISVNISNYGELVPQREALIDVLKKRGIHILVEPQLLTWRSTGGFEDRLYSAEKIHQVFANCSVLECKSLNAGRLYLCPRAFHGQELGMVPKNIAEFIDLRQVDAQAFWEKLERLYENPIGLTTCRFCSGGDYQNAPVIPCAQQAPLDWNGKDPF